MTACRKENSMILTLDHVEGVFREGWEAGATFNGDFSDSAGAAATATADWDESTARTMYAAAGAERPPFNDDDRAALRRLSETLGAVVDKRALPEALIVPVKRVLEAFGRGLEQRGCSGPGGSAARDSTPSVRGGASAPRNRAQVLSPARRRQR